MNMNKAFYQKPADLPPGGFLTLTQDFLSTAESSVKTKKITPATSESNNITANRKSGILHVLLPFRSGSFTTWSTDSSIRKSRACTDFFVQLNLKFTNMTYVFTV